MGDFIIRAATPADTGHVDALLQRTYPRLLKADYPPSVLVAAIPAMTRARPQLMSCGTYYLAIENGQVLGAGGWTPDRKRAGWGDIRHVVTDDRHLRRGIGRAIMEHSFATARGAGLQHLECWATLTAEPFYASVAFQRIGPMTVQLQGAIDFPAIRMQRAL
ncbi:GNAT family N-acetyltransferase [Shimia ponticola]|uniref:GNAT family N-acetyltransferase n=1 Tax=Shimia ponticola TaxID=2582893 RepID=UPI0011BF3CF5|nr:GNAT family N-acetyltransferase [Shimia ponticola]